MFGFDMHFKHHKVRFCNLCLGEILELFVIRPPWASPGPPETWRAPDISGNFSDYFMFFLGSFPIREDFVFACLN